MLLVCFLKAVESLLLLWYLWRENNVTRAKLARKLAYSIKITIVKAAVKIV